jgi:hypothetical protein
LLLPEVEEWKAYIQVQNEWYLSCLAKYSTPEEAAKHSSQAFVSMQHFEEAVKKIRIQREMKPAEKTRLPQYG